MKGWGYVGVDTWRFADISAVVVRPISRTWRRNFESSLAVSIETVPRRHRVSTIRFGCAVVSDRKDAENSILKKQLEELESYKREQVLPQ